MAQNELIANLTQHQTITDALLTTMGKYMAVQQDLLHIPVYDAKNMPLKTFIQDVENGYSICPAGIRIPHSMKGSGRKFQGSLQ